MLTFRHATSNDLPALHALASVCLLAPKIDSATLAEKFDRRPWLDAAVNRVHVAEVDEKIVGFMQSVVRPALDRAWVGLFAVAAAYRRRGVASALLARVRADWPDGIGEVQAVGIPGNYLLPGVDERQIEASAFLKRHGFEYFKDCVNLTVDLDRPLDEGDMAGRLTEQGVELRRATPDDAGRLDLFFAAQFGTDWRCEADLALSRTPPGLHLALETGRIIAFAAHSAQNAPWGFFGPMGTAPAAEGRGIGRVLLCRCLADLRAAGHRRAIIPWVGPVGFYERCVGAKVDQRFRRFRLRLKSSS